MTSDVSMSMDDDSILIAERTPRSFIPRSTLDLDLLDEHKAEWDSALAGNVR